MIGLEPTLSLILRNSFAFQPLPLSIIIFRDIKVFYHFFPVGWIHQRLIQTGTWKEKICQNCSRQAFNGSAKHEINQLPNDAESFNHYPFVPDAGYILRKV